MLTYSITFVELQLFLDKILEAETLSVEWTIFISNGWIRNKSTLCFPFVWVYMCISSSYCFRYLYICIQILRMDYFNSLDIPTGVSTCDIFSNIFIHLFIYLEGIGPKGERERERWATFSSKWQAKLKLETTCSVSPQKLAGI